MLVVHVPARPLRPCPHPGCSHLVIQGRCEQHRSIPQKEFDAARLGRYEQRYDRRWQKARLVFLQKNPLCACDECQSGKIKATPATVVDHIIPHRGNVELFWDESNWQALSKSHHDRKTRSESRERVVMEKEIDGHRHMQWLVGA